MKITILTDLEGVSGVSGVSYINSASGRPDLIAEARKLLAGDINACVEGCFRGGATKVVVKDGHGGGFNVKRSDIDDRAFFMDGCLNQEQYLHFGDSDAVILLGYHAMAGTAAALLEHTFSSRSIQKMWLNGNEIGEVGILAHLAGELEVPVIMVSGDDKVCAEAHALNPAIVTCQVKTSFGCSGVLMPPLSETRKLITDKTIEAVTKLKNIPYIPKCGKVTLRVEKISRERIPYSADVRQLDARTYEVDASSVCEAVMRVFLG